MPAMDEPVTCGDPDCPHHHAPRWVEDVGVQLLLLGLSGDRMLARLVLSVAVARMSPQDLHSMALRWAEHWRIRGGFEHVDRDAIPPLQFVGCGADGRPRDPITGDITGDIDAQPPGARFAARFLRARLADDQQQARDLLVSVIRGGDAAVHDALAALLEACALGILAHQRTRTARTS